MSDGLICERNLPGGRCLATGLGQSYVRARMKSIAGRSVKSGPKTGCLIYQQVILRWIKDEYFTQLSLTLNASMMDTHALTVIAYSVSPSSKTLRAPTSSLEDQPQFPVRSIQARTVSSRHQPEMRSGCEEGNAMLAMFCAS